MKKLYLNIIWPGILIGLLIPFSGKLSSFQQLFAAKPEVNQAMSDSHSRMPESPTALLTETSESVCGELHFEPGNPQGMLRLPAFDPSKGSLTGVQISTESKLIADIFRKNLHHNDFHALFSADLVGTLPDGRQFSHTAKLSYQASLRSDRQMRAGIQTLMDETTTETQELKESLDQFYGAGQLNIPLEAINLTDVKAEDFNYRTQLKAKVCLDYIYESH